MGQSPPGNTYNRAGHGLPLINGPTEFTDRSPIKIQWTTSPARTCEPGDLLICVRGSSTGRVNYADDVYAIGRGVAAIRAKDANDTSYLSYRVIAAVAEILAAAAGSTFPSVDGASFRRIPIPLPDPDEQVAISTALADVDRLIESLDALIAKKRAIKQATMQQLLTGKTRLPGFSSKWELRRIGDMGNCLMTGSNPRSHLGTDDPVQYVHYGDVHAHPSPVLDVQSCTLPTIEPNLLGSAAALEDGDLVMVDASEDMVGVGKSVEVVGVNGLRVVAGLHTLLLRGLTDAWAPGFKAYLQFIPAFRTALQRVATGISVYATSKSQLLDVTLQLPKVEEQSAIAEVLRDMDDEIDALQRRRAKTAAIKQGMMQQLLTGRIRLVATAEEIH